MSIALFSWLATMGLAAQNPQYAAQPTEEKFVCGTTCTHTPPPIVANKTIKGLPSHHQLERNEDFIFKGDDHLYVFRMAMVVTPEAYSLFFNNDLERLNKYIDKLEQDLNTIYRRDCGIEFEILRSDKIVLEHSIANRPNRIAGVVDSIFGQKNFEIGWVMQPVNANASGVAIQYGVLNNANKSFMYANNLLATIAHEIGHLFGAPHTHDNFDSYVTEQGRGFSLMSYGSPRTFLSLASIRIIRSTLRSMGYYTDATRTTYVAGSPEIENAPYIKPHGAASSQPVLDKRSIKKEYVVTKGTRYQFYFPTTNANKEGFLYHAHPYDPSLPGRESNPIQRLYEASTTPNVMFSPRYIAPEHKDGLMQERFLEYSNQYEPGTYTYMLSAFRYGMHDVARTQLKIVEGTPFRITYFKTTDATYRDKAYPGRTNLELRWNTCQELYGADSKVRILLSKDFGKTFDYVLADNEPNDGSWSGTCPYVNIGHVAYPEIGNVRGGVIKIEVIGEAAFALSQEKPHSPNSDQGRVIPTGGFTTDTSTEVQFNPAPPIYLEVDSEEALGELLPLTATYKGRSATVNGTQTLVDNLCYRKWTATVGGRTATYTQLIKIKQEITDAQLAHIQAEALAAKVRDLYQHIGTLGYPKADIALTQQFLTHFLQVFTPEGKIRKDITTEQVSTLENTLVALGNISDEDVVMPLAGVRYKIANFQRTYKGEKRYYLSPATSEGGNETFAPNDAQAGADWDCEILDSLYRFTSNGTALSLNNTTSGLNGLRLTRGYTWGAFALISGKRYPRVAQVNTENRSVSFSELPHEEMTHDYTINAPGYIISTDFQFFPVATDFDIFYHTEGYEVPTARIVTTPHSNVAATQEIALTPVSENVYRGTIPAAFGREKIEFTTGGQSAVASLVGKTAHYGEGGKRVHRIELTDNEVTTLFLDFPVVLPAGLTAFTATAAWSNNPSQTAIKVAAIQEKLLPAYTPVIVKGTAGKVYTLVLEEAEGMPLAVTTNSLNGNIVAAPTASLNHDYLYFPLQQPTSTTTTELTYRRLAAGEELPANGAYLRLHKYAGNADVASVVISLTEINNAITGVLPLGTQRTTNDKVFSITGKVVGTTADFHRLPAGVYIVNGQKVVK